MDLLTKEEIIQYKSAKNCYICDEEFCYDKNDQKKYLKYRKVKDHDHYTRKYRGAAHSQCNLNYSIQKEIPVIAHNSSHYDQHFIIRELVEVFKCEIANCIGENMEKYKTFSIPIRKKDNENNVITCKLKFIDSMRFMNTSLEKLVNNLSEIDAYNKEMTGFEKDIVALQSHLDNYVMLEKKKSKIFTTKIKTLITTMSAIINNYPNKKMSFQQI